MKRNGKGKSQIREFYHDFTPTERRIREWICRGHTNRVIAKFLHTSEQTVKNMIGRIYDKVGCSNRVEFFLMTQLSTEEHKQSLELEALELEQRLVIVRKQLEVIEMTGGTR